MVLLLLLVCFLGAGGMALAQEQRPVDFSTEIEPIFREHCYECHGPEKRKGGLRLTNRTDAFTAGDLGIPVIEESDSSLSPLYELIRSSDQDERMPKDSPPLTAEQIELIRRWIDEGASWPDDGSTLDHWAYRAPARPAPPSVANTGWPINEIDRFVLSRLEAAGMEPNPPAAPARLLRRVSLDLIGLPPTPNQIDAFAADPSAEAYAAFVDELLASPRYGERWAVQWLDLARYADSAGFQADPMYESWAYRDWVIGALNDDMPFDQFTIEQLAGDLLPEPTLSQKIATGFHRSAATNIEAGVDAAESRVMQIVDRVNVTSTVWLGSTMECAQCHNHKYDPFSQREYYELYAFLNNTAVEISPYGNQEIVFQLDGPKVSVPLSLEESARHRSLVEELKEAEDRLEQDDYGPLFPRWWKQTRSALIQTPIRWYPAEVVGFESSDEETHELGDDGLVSIGGPVPETAIHRIRIRPRGNGVAALRLEILSPEEGEEPRGPGERPAPKVTEVQLFVGPPDQSETAGLWVPRALKKFRVAIDGNVATNWKPLERATQGGATFLLEAPLEDPGELEVVVAQLFGGGATADRLRILTTDAPQPLLQLPPKISAILTTQRRPRRRQLGMVRNYYEAEGRIAGTPLPALRRAFARLRTTETPVLQELETPRETRVHRRGDFLDEGELVSPGTPRVLHPFGDDLPRNRLGLARWLVDPRNPLVARVTVNRWWDELFGAGLVRSPEDFGTRSDAPSHPDLLDWLAVEFVEGGWSMKSIHRKMVLSATYRQSSRVSPQKKDLDPSNRLLARSERRRLPAEILRDTGLAISGLLDEAMGGPPAYPPQPRGIWALDGTLEPRYSEDRNSNRYRRGVYVVWRRTAPPPSFVAFDAPNRSTCTVRRSSTNTPLQALALMNDRAWVEMAAGLSRRLIKEDLAETTEERITRGLRIAVGRVPRPGEVARFTGLVDRTRRRFEENPEAADELLASAWPVQLEGKPEPVEFATWFFVANVLLNLDETISRT